MWFFFLEKNPRKDYRWLRECTKPPRRGRVALSSSIFVRQRSSVINRRNRTRDNIPWERLLRFMYDRILIGRMSAFAVRLPATDVMQH